MSTYLLRDIPKKLHADLKRTAERQRRTIKQVILQAIQREISDSRDYAQK